MTNPPWEYRILASYQMQDMAEPWLGPQEDTMDETIKEIRSRIPDLQEYLDRPEPFPDRDLYIEAVIKEMLLLILSEQQR